MIFRNFRKFKEVWFLLFLLSFTILHNIADRIFKEDWNSTAYLFTFFLSYALFLWMRNSVHWLRLPLPISAWIGLYAAGMFLLGVVFISV
ncbi:hypothetical protein D479_18054 [Halobacillus sp. BAB-2008]|nr:hypothetical protein D479_18054 [Halobacillus sp. BAB-2008]